MSEQEPTTAIDTRDERDDVAKLQKEFEETYEKLKRAELDRDKVEVFGKFDVTAPNEGEDTYQSYMSQRPVAPTEGIVREEVRNSDGSVQSMRRNLQTGKTASINAYGAQNGTTQDYYDQKAGITKIINGRVVGAESTGVGAFEAPKYESMTTAQLFHEREKARELGDIAVERIINHKYLYEHMGVVQLAKEAARARKLNDEGKEEQIIREALVTHLTINTTEDDTETSEQAQDRYEKEVARYEELVVKFVERGNAESQHAAQSHEKPGGEGAPSARPAKGEAEPAVYFKGKKVTVAKVENIGNGSVLTIVDADGNVEKIHSDELTSENMASPAPADVEPPAQKDNTIDKDKAVKPSTPFPAAVFTPAPASMPASQPSDTPFATGFGVHAGNRSNESDQTQEETPKGWWQRAGNRVRTYAGAAYWREKFNTAESNPDDWLNRGISDEESQQEKDKKRKRNRIFAMAATVALLAPTLIAGIGANNSAASSESNDGGSSNSSTPNPGEGENPDISTEKGTPPPPASGPEATTPDASAPTETNPVTNLPLEGAPASGPEVIPPAPEISPEVFNISSGEGGYELFQNAGLDAQSWNTNAQKLSTEFPKDFYNYNNEVRIAHTGPLSQGAQDYINALKKG